MARNYAALPYDYLEEMEALNDAEFGRLTRALLAYSMTGERIALCGNERFYAKRVMSQEDRFKASYEEVSVVRSEAGKAGAAARWQNGYTETNTETNTDTLPSNDGKSDTRAARFTPPSADDVSAYVKAQGYHVNAERFVAFYEQKGWMVGKNHMKDWKAAVRSWETRWKEEHGGGCNGSAGEPAKKWNIPGEVVL